MAVPIVPTKKEYLNAIHRAMLAQSRYGNKSKPERPIYKCPICHDKEYVWNESLQVMVPCKCHAARTMERRLLQVGISSEEYKKRCIDSFPIDRPEAVNMKALAVKFLASHQKGEGIIYTGKSGTLKTSICMAICMELTKAGQMHKYFSYRDEMPILKWQMFKQADKYQETIKELITCDNLFIDDLFKTKKSAMETRSSDFKMEVTSTDLQIMFQLINGRYMNKKTTIFSTEYPLKKIIEEIDEATGTRIYEMCRKYNMSCHDVNRRLMK